MTSTRTPTFGSAVKPRARMLVLIVYAQPNFGYTNMRVVVNGVND